MAEQLNIDKLSPTKRNKIINAGLLTFGRNGYHKTSMADVAKEAHVSKASIFYYFDSKERLFNYLSDFVFDEVVKGPLVKDTDFFKYLDQAMQYKIKLENDHLGFFEFSQLICNDQTSDQVLKISNDKKQRITTFLSLMTDNVDWSKFKPEVDPQKLVNIVMWVAEGYTRDSTSNDKQSLTDYFNQLRQLTYKPEYLNKEKK